MTTRWDGQGDPQADAPTCLDAHHDQAGCNGLVEYRESLSGTGTPIPRCARHWRDRLIWQQAHDRKYPTQAPSDFDPLYAGERWDEED